MTTNPSRGRRLGVIASVSIALVFAFASVLVAQESQSQIAEWLLASNAQDRARGLSAARALRNEPIGPVLRSALAIALENEGRIHANARQEGTRVPNPELLPGLALLVSRFDNLGASAIPGLIGALGTSPAAARALARMGTPAARAVISHLHHSSAADVEMDALLALRFMVESRSSYALSTAVIADIKQVAMNYLNSSTVTTLWRAIDLADATGDPVLRVELQRIADDADHVRRKGLVDENLIAQTRARAADRLAGVPAKPRRQ